MATYHAFFLPTPLMGSRGWLPAAQSSLLCRVYWRFADLDGSPLEGRRVVFSNVFRPLFVGGSAVMATQVECQTDAEGEGEVWLFRGSECEVTIDRTSITRKVTIPDQAAAELMSLVSDAPDPFDIQRAYPYGHLRRSI